MKIILGKIAPLQPKKEGDPPSRFSGMFYCDDAETYLQLAALYGKKVDVSLPKETEEPVISLHGLLEDIYQRVLQAKGIIEKPINDGLLEGEKL